MDDRQGQGDMATALKRYKIKYLAQWMIGHLSRNHKIKKEFMDYGPPGFYSREV